MLHVELHLRASKQTSDCITEGIRYSRKTFFSGSVFDCEPSNASVRLVLIAQLLYHPRDYIGN